MYKKFLKICKPSFHKKGFTLTEMMAVAVILSILIAVVVGSFRSSLERARFQEGLQAAEVVSAAVERFYYDNPNLSSSLRQSPTFDQLDIDLTNVQPCEGGEAAYCRKIKNFEVQIMGPQPFGGAIPVVVGAFRGKAPNRSGANGSYQYQIRVIPGFVKSTYSGNDAVYRNQISVGGTCDVGSTTDVRQKARDLCFTMGYTQKCSALDETEDVSNASTFCKP